MGAQPGLGRCLGWWAWRLVSEHRWRERGPHPGIWPPSARRPKRRGTPRCGRSSGCWYGRTTPIDAGLPERAGPDGGADASPPRTRPGSGSASRWSTCRSSRRSTSPSRPRRWMCCRSGRLDLGLGIGWSAGRSSPRPARPARRGAGPRSTCGCCARCGATSPARFDGEFYTVPPSGWRPAPVQPGGPPILLGGMARPALERAGRIGGGLDEPQPGRPGPHRRGHRDRARRGGRRRADAVRVVVRGVVRPVEVAPRRAAAAVGHPTTRSGRTPGGWRSAA